MSRSLTVSDLALDPSCLTISCVSPSGLGLTLRLLLPEDGDRLGRFFEDLSPATRNCYAPHPLTLEYGQQLCAELDYHTPSDTPTLRFVGLISDDPPEGDGVVAYFILALGIRDGEASRYRERGSELDPDTTCTFAPCVADAHQSQGVGSALVPGILNAARALRFHHMVLSGGTRTTNHRAIRFYEKAGFRKVGEFTTRDKNDTPIGNQDMVLEL